MATDTAQLDPAEAGDEARIEAFAEQLFGFYTGGMLTYLIDIGHRTGLFDATASGPATSTELADRAGLQERYVREWLGAMVTGGVVAYDPASGSFHLPSAHAACLTGPGATNLSPFAQLNTHLGKHVHQVAHAFRAGGGVPYEEFRPEFTDVMDAVGRGGFDEALVSQWIDLVPGVREQLVNGARVVDVGCGTGHAVVLLAEAFPASTFVGYDISEEAIVRAREEASQTGLDNARFEVRDAAALRINGAFDVAFVFDAVHDQVAPATVLRNIHDLLTPGGVFLMFEPAMSSRLEDNIAHPLAPFLYAVSTLHCLTISLAHDGAGLGAAWGQQLACAMLHDAGFRVVTVHDVPNEPFNALFVARR